MACFAISNISFYLMEILNKMLILGTIGWFNNKIFHHTKSCKNATLYNVEELFARGVLFFYERSFPRSIRVAIRGGIDIDIATHPS